MLNIALHANGCVNIGCFMQHRHTHTLDSFQFLILFLFYWARKFSCRRRASEQGKTHWEIERERERGAIKCTDVERKINYRNWTFADFLNANNNNKNNNRFRFRQWVYGGISRRLAHSTQAAMILRDARIQSHFTYTYARVALAREIELCSRMQMETDSFKLFVPLNYSILDILPCVRCPPIELRAQLAPSQMHRKYLIISYDAYALIVCSLSQTFSDS